MEWLRDDLAAIYPQFGVRLAHAGLALTPPTDVELLELAPIVGEPGGIVEPGREIELLGWVAGAGDDSVDHFLRAAWRGRERPTVEAWRAPFAAVLDGRVIGLVMLYQSGGDARGTLTTWSWLARTEQGRGIGRRVRLMLLELAFAHLGASRATSRTAERNAASRRVSTRCGYRETHRAPDEHGVLEVHYAVTPAAWRRRRLADVEVDGAEALRAAIGTPPG